MYKLLREIEAWIASGAVELEARSQPDHHLVGTLNGFQLMINRDSIYYGIAEFFGADALNKGTAKQREHIRSVCAGAFETWASQQADKLAEMRERASDIVVPGL